MSDKAKRKSKQKNQFYKVAIIRVAIILVIVELLGLAAMSILFSVNVWNERQIELTFEVYHTDWAQTLDAHTTILGTRQSQIESSATAAIENQTATAGANSTATP